MTRDADYNRDGRGLSQFEKNRFFKGKLMTPRDMEAEQTYHADRLQTLNRFIDGAGIVYGLDVQSITETEDGIDVTINSGLALDECGRPIVVDQVTTKTLPAPSGDELHLFIQYSEIAVETVPVPDTDGAIDEEAVPSRDVEVFELTHREEPPADPTAIPDLDLSDLDFDDADPRTIARTIAERYHERHRSGTADGADPAVYLGAFERTPAGSWEPASDGTGQSYVYDHDMLFTALVHHLADTDNPHRTPVQEQDKERPDDLDGIVRRLDAMEGTVENLERERDMLAQYVLRKTIKDRVRFFETLSERLEPYSGEGARLAREIAEVSRDGLDATPDREEAYRRHLSTLMDRLIQLGEPLEQVVTEESLERYLKSVSRLQSTIESDEPLLELVDAHDQVCEAADSLDVLVDVVPEA
ncbi:hypothetical protein [Halopiger djelfimassiliensis]|uniref:hypothetical protein n=1 Tax=Halopiger djelfimassiliensis TaxID=1293047 RepID=UPI00067780CF|nr:hypothetical protein [Halopiger djelfimassiliensis]